MKEAYRELNEHIIPSKQLTQNVLEQVSSPSKRLRPLTVVAAVLAVALLVLLPLMPQQRVYASVYMTINPQVRIDVRSDDTVIGLQGLNSDGEELIAGYTFRQKTLELVLDELVERAVDMGFLPENGQVTLKLDAADSEWLSTHSRTLASDGKDQTVGQILVQVVKDSTHPSETVGDTPQPPAAEDTIAQIIGITGFPMVDGTTSANVSMGMGTFAFDNDCIYFPGKGGICEYDLSTGDLTTYDVVEDAPLRYLSVSNGKVIFCGSNSIGWIDLENGQQTDQQKVFYGEKLYMDGDDVYYLTAVADTFVHENLSTGEVKEYFSCVNNYLVTQDSVYVCASEEKYDKYGRVDFALYKASRKDMVFEKIETEKEPIAVCVNQNDIFYAKSGYKWTVYHYSDGVETELPIRSFYFQSIGDSIIYEDQKVDENGNHLLKSYNWKTGEETVLFSGGVSRFCILADRYICVDSSSGCYLIDLYTGTTTRMLR